MSSANGSTKGINCHEFVVSRFLMVVHLVVKNVLGSQTQLRSCLRKLLVVTENLQELCHTVAGKSVFLM